MSPEPLFEGQIPLDTYGDMGFRIANKRVEGSVIMTPAGVFRWTASSFAMLSKASLDPLITHAARIEVLLFGCGPSFVRMPGSIGEYLLEAGLRYDVMDTGAACRTYNVLVSDRRRVAAALIAI